MNEILLSIHPEWLRKIIDGEKTVELRKSRPNDDLPFPFKVYFYETRAGRGAVVGECQCYFIEKAKKPPYNYGIVQGSGLWADAIAEYAKGKPVYGWYLAKAVEYKFSKPLSNFGLKKAPQSWCYTKECE
jgi:predicted transcriptional regulator